MPNDEELEPPAEDQPIADQPKVEVPLEDPVQTDQPEEPQNAPQSA